MEDADHHEEGLQKFFVGDSVGTEMDLDREKPDNWDQFAENEKRFNVVPSFDASKYTTVLNMDALSERQIREAAKIAESIEKAPSTNFHVREDRGQVKETGEVGSDEDDEEKQYSAVIGTGQYKDEKKKKRGRKPPPQKREEIKKAIQADLGMVEEDKSNSSQTNFADKVIAETERMSELRCKFSPLVSSHYNPHL